MKRNNMKTNIFILALAVSAGAAEAKVYECNVGGVTVYTSRPSSSCHTPDLPKIGRYSSLPAPRVHLPSLSGNAAPAPAPRPSSGGGGGGTMKANAPVREAPPLQTAELSLPKPSGSSGRRSILEQELANERQALNSAQNELSVARAQKNQNRASQLTASIQDRQQNIQALQRELSRM